MTTTTVRYFGITDEITDCGCCGRTGLKHTVMLEILDGENESDGILYYGTDCAARKLGRSSYAVRQAAETAEMIRRDRLSEAKRMLAGIDLTQRPSVIARAYIAKHPARFAGCIDDVAAYGKGFRESKWYREAIATEGRSAL